jgi:hypothetical protein
MVGAKQREYVLLNVGENGSDLNCLMLRAVVSDRHPQPSLFPFSNNMLYARQSQLRQFQLAVKHDSGQGLGESHNPRNGKRVADGPPVVNGSGKSSTANSRCY